MGRPNPTSPNCLSSIEFGVSYFFSFFRIITFQEHNFIYFSDIRREALVESRVRSKNDLDRKDHTYQNSEISQGSTSKSSNLTGPNFETRRTEALTFKIYLLGIFRWENCYLSKFTTESAQFFF